MATSFNVNQADLAFILNQIRISELHAGGMDLIQAIQTVYPGMSAADAALTPFGLRTVDGRNNNLVPGQSEYGAADTLFPRLTDPTFLNDPDGDSIQFGPNAVTNNNYAVMGPGFAGSVADADPRIISNLIADMTTNNPAAVSAYLSNPLSVAQFQADHGGRTPVAPGDPRAISDPANFQVVTDTDLATIPNQSPDVGLSPGFNSWMTIFGQFFDHGLDLVTKGNNGTVYIPLQPDDPLYVPGSTTNFMALTRATPTTVNGVAQHENTTTSFIDQNQTYTSHASHQVFLREYVRNASGDVISTGKLLDGAQADSISNWGEVKAQALEMLGIRLTDFDVSNVPLLLTDQYGRFIPGANGYAQIVTSDPDGILNSGDEIVVEGTAEGILIPTNALRTGHAFLDDIAHHAAPSTVRIQGVPFRQVADADNDLNGDGVFNLADIDTNADGTVNALDFADFSTVVADVNRDGSINASDFDRNGDGQFNNTDFDTNRDGLVNAADLIADDGNPLTYDNEMLNSHFVTGDGRGNENIALTAVHSIFHSEHNRLVEANKDTLIASGDAAVVNEWLLPGPGGVRNQITQAQLDAINAITNPAARDAAIDALNWDGERLFQSARFVNEMQYQHLVFEEFARRISPSVDPFVFTNTAEIDASILAEFAHVVYRFGHSMLTGTVDRLNNNLNVVDGTDQASLLDAFLNPQMYLASGATTEEINANLIRGLTRDVGNEIDEFLVDDLRNNLVGLPLDLAALNIARGRETGVGSLNNVRAQLYNDFSHPDLKPYTSWADFAQHLKNPASIINFIAAYGTHSTIINATTLADKRAAATLLVLGGTGAPADRRAFLSATDAYAGGNLGGLNNVDLWIGGLAEEKNEFGGMLGSTFNFIFEYQMEHLQNGDRFYYLSRTQGTNLLNQLEPNTFSDLVMRNSELGGEYSTHLSGSLFLTPDHILELDRGIAQDGDDPTHDDPILEALGPKVDRTYSGVQVADENGVLHDVGGTLNFTGGEHVVIGGTEGNDTLTSDLGDDTLWGDGGDDNLNGGAGADNVFGGEGDDIIEDPFGDDVLRGNQGNDVISGGAGFDLIFGDQGNDYIILGQDAAEAFGGQGNDFILGGSAPDALLGNEGDDWIEGGEGFDGLTGDNSELFFNSPIVGHDVLWAQGNDADYDAESGDDIMVSGLGVQRMEGMFGFDWAIAKYDTSTIHFDLGKGIAFPAVQGDVLRDRFDQVEAASGWNNNDRLDGDERGGAVGVGELSFANDVLTAEGIDRINGFRAWFGDVLDTLVTIGAPGANGTSFQDGNVLMGGAGNDTIQGKGGFDIIDGDSWLNVRIRIQRPNGEVYFAESMNTDTSVAGSNAGRVTDANGNLAFSGRSLNSLLLDGTINPGELSIVREILSAPSGVDTAVFRGTQDQYNIEGRVVDANGNLVTQANDANGDGFISVTHLANGIDDTDFVRNVELLQFSDGTATGTTTIDLRQAPTLDMRWTGAIPADAALPGAGDLIATLSTLNPSGVTTTGFTLISSTSPGGGGFAIDPTTGQITRTGAAMAINTTYTLTIGSTNSTGALRTETFTIRTGTAVANTIVAADTTDHIIYGLAGNDTLTGNSGDDILYGQAGNDTLDGGAGRNTLDGGIGNDTYIVQDTDDVVVESAAAGTDTVQSAISYTLGANVENLTLTGTANTNGTGNTLNNVITGNGGNNTLDGAGGTDTLVGGLGDDTYIVNNAVTVTEGAGAGTDTVRSSITYTLGANLENLTLTGSANINGTGNDANNVITGNSGNNILNGGTGNDSMAGGAGDDIYTIGIGDTATENLNEGVDRVNASVSYTLGDHIEHLTLTGNASINATGNDLNNTLTGNRGANVLNGGLGADSMVGGLGNDTYFVDNIGDSITETGGTDTVNASISYNLTAGNPNTTGNIVSGNLENLTLTGTDAINGTGNNLNNVITGNDAANGLSGAVGNDTLIGGAGDDTLTGGTGGDRLTGGIGADTFSFATGDSTFNVQDTLTDLLIGTDVIDGPINFTFNASAVKGEIASLSVTNINTAVTAGGTFGIGQAATFTFAGQTFLAMNTAGAGFQATDTLINITGYTGDLSTLVIA
jgi:Ca2+-binding RTX toxin-like protein